MTCPMRIPPRCRTPSRTAARRSAPSAARCRPGPRSAASSPTPQPAHAPSQRTWLVRRPRVSRVCFCLHPVSAIRSWRSPPTAVAPLYARTGHLAAVRRYRRVRVVAPSLVGTASISDTTFPPAPAGPSARSHDREPGARGRRRGQARQQRRPRRQADGEDRRPGGQARQEAGRGRVGQGRRHERREGRPGRPPRGHRRGRRRQRHQGRGGGPGHRRAHLAAPPGAHAAALGAGGGRSRPSRG